MSDETSPLIPDESNEKLFYQRRWKSIRIIYLIMFVSSISYSICMSSLWPYISVLDHLSTTAFLGWVIASYSLGQVVSSPLFGYWSARWNVIVLPLVVSLAMNGLSSVFYSYVEALPSNRRYYVLLSRTLVGFGGGNGAVLRSYVSEATLLDERTHVMALISGMQALGFICGPAIQAAMSPIGYPGFIHTRALYFNLYTAPGFFNALADLFLILTLFFFFRDCRLTRLRSLNCAKENAESKGARSEDCLKPSEEDFSGKSDSPDVKVLKKPDSVVLVALIVLYFNILLFFSVFESIGAPLSMHMFSWTRQQATMNNGIILALLSTLCIFVFFVVKLISKRVDERKVFLAGLLIITICFLIGLPLGSKLPDLPYESIQPWKNATNVTSLFRDNSFASTTAEPVGCPFLWCRHIHKVTFGQFLAITSLFGVGYPICNLMVFVLFSKALGLRPQGLYMGYLAMAGCLGRAVGPVMATFLYDSYGPLVYTSAFASAGVLSLILCISVYKRLVPLID